LVEYLGHTNVAVVFNTTLKDQKRLSGDELNAILGVGKESLPTPGGYKNDRLPPGAAAQDEEGGDNDLSPPSAELNSEFEAHTEMVCPNSISKIIIPEHISKDTFKKTKYVPFVTAKLLLDLYSTKEKFRDKSLEINDICNRVILLFPKMIKIMNKVVAEFRLLHEYQVFKSEIEKRQNEIEKQQKELEERKKHDQLVIAELERQRGLIDVVKIEKRNFLYIFTTNYHKNLGLYKFGLTTNLQNRLVNLQNNDKIHGGFYVKTVQVYESNFSEKQIHSCFDTFHLRHSGEWFKSPSDEKSIQILEAIANGLNDMYDIVA